MKGLPGFFIHETGFPFVELRPATQGRREMKQDEQIDELA
jgi:hypothetical protein